MGFLSCEYEHEVVLCSMIAMEIAFSVVSRTKNSGVNFLKFSSYFFVCIVCFVL